MEQQFLTLAQVAERLQVTERTIYRYLEAKELKGIKIGRVWRIRPDDLETFLSARENVTQ